LQPRAIGAAFIHQRAHGYVPAVIDFAQNVFCRDANISKEQFVKFGFAGHLSERTNFDARRFHIHEQGSEAFMFCGAAVRPHNQLAPIAHPAIAGPNFLPVHDVMIAIQFGFRLQPGKI
jgi:hypothetical protein